MPLSGVLNNGIFIEEDVMGKILKKAVLVVVFTGLVMPGTLVANDFFDVVNYFDPTLVPIELLPILQRCPFANNHTFFRAI